MSNGETKTVDGISIEAVPMYNVVRGFQGNPLHPKGHGNGYVVTVGGKRLYIAGDTECTPEMKALKNIDVAFMPMNLPYTMTPAEAAACALVFKPKIVYPYHYRGQDVVAFASSLKASGIEVRLREWYRGLHYSSSMKAWCHRGLHSGKEKWQLGTVVVCVVTVNCH